LAEYSTSFLVNYINEYYLPESGIIVDLLRYYVPEGSFTSVEHGKTDVNGDFILHFVTEDVKYKIIARQNNEIVYQSEEFLAVCQSIPCTMNFEN